MYTIKDKILFLIIVVFLIMMFVKNYSSKLNLWLSDKVSEDITPALHHILPKDCTTLHSTHYKLPHYVRLCDCIHNLM